MDYVVKSLYDRKEERLLDVVQDLAAIDDAARISSADCLRDMDELKKQLDGLKDELARVSGSSSAAGLSPKKSMAAAFAEALGLQIEGFQAAVDDLDRTRAILVRNVDEVIEYFGESATCSTGEIFSVLQHFRRALSAAKEVVERKERMSKNASMRRSISPPKKEVR